MLFVDDECSRSSSIIMPAFNIETSIFFQPFAEGTPFTRLVGGLVGMELIKEQNTALNEELRAEIEGRFCCFVNITVDMGYEAAVKSELRMDPFRRNETAGKFAWYRHHALQVGTCCGHVMKKGRQIRKKRAVLESLLVGAALNTAEAVESKETHAANLLHHLPGKRHAAPIEHSELQIVAGLRETCRKISDPEEDAGICNSSGVPGGAMVNRPGVASDHHMTGLLRRQGDDVGIMHLDQGRVGQNEEGCRSCTFENPFESSHVLPCMDAHAALIHQQPGNGAEAGQVEFQRQQVKGEPEVLLCQTFPEPAQACRTADADQARRCGRKVLQMELKERKIHTRIHR